MRKLNVVVFVLSVALSSAALAQEEENPPDMGAPPAAEAPPAEAPAAEPAVVTTGIPTVVLGLGAGVYIPTSALGVNFLLGIDGAYQLPFLGGRFGVGGGLAYSQPTTSGVIEDSRVPSGSADYDSTMRELVLDVLFSYRVFGWDSVWSPHAAIGPVFYFLDHKVSSLGVQNNETSTQVGFLAAVGVDYFIWRGALVGEVRFPFAVVGQRTTGDSNVGAVSVVFGYRFRL